MSAPTPSRPEAAASGVTLGQATISEISSTSNDAATEVQTDSGTTSDRPDLVKHTSRPLPQDPGSSSHVLQVQTNSESHISRRLTDQEGGTMTVTSGETRAPQMDAHSGGQAGESVVDFLRAVPGPLDENVIQVDGPSLSPENEASHVRRLASGLSFDVAAHYDASNNTDTPRASNSRDGIRTRASTMNDFAPTTSQTDAIPVADSRRNGMYLREGSNLRPVSSGSGVLSRQESYILPRWQPDAEVTYCPICNTQFSFFVRKHHCRKCGRVVCNSCSPHRITIPYQYIVQDATQPGVLSASPDHQGGMKVRLCNPCVPDPNTLPPEPQGPPPAYYETTNDREDQTWLREGMERDLLATSRPRAATASSGHSSTAGRRHSQRSEPARTRHTPSSSLAVNPYPNRMSARIESTGNVRYTPANASQSRGHASRHQSLSMAAPRAAAVIDRNRPLPPVPRIAEEDECPICHSELPSRTLPNFEVVREHHIMQCIDDQLSANSGHQSRPGAHTSNSQPAPSLGSYRLRAPSTVRGPQASSTSNPSTALAPNLPSAFPPRLSSVAAPSTPSSTENPAFNIPIGAAPSSSSNINTTGTSQNALIIHPSTPPRRTRMFPYKATEKDCVDDAECTICLEEFEVGNKMVRLECFCRFHESCIQRWFVGHPGRCPLHQHDGGYLI